MEVEEPVSTTSTQDEEVKKDTSSSTMEVEESDTKPDTTVESVNEKETEGDETMESEVSPEKMKKKILSPGIDREEGEKEDDKENVKEKPVRKRKWGSKTGQPTGAKRISSYNISTDSLKGLIPEIKLTEPVLDLGNDDDRISDVEEDKRDVTIRRTVVVKDDQAKEDLEEGEAPDSPEEGEAVEEEKEENDMEVQEDERKVKKAEQVVIRRVSQKKPLIETEEPSQVKSRSPSPARNPVTNIVHLRNLVRPFTLLQLKDLLRRTGKLADDKFWIDSIKSHCYATFETEDQAVETRKALHGKKWPSSNPKILQVDYATPDEIDYHKNEEEAPRLAREKAQKEAKARKEEEKRRKAEREVRLAKKKEEEEAKKKKPPPIREWDRDKIRQSEEREDPQRRRRPSSGSPTKDRRRREKSREKERDKERPAKKEKTDKKEDEEPPAKLLDDLFKKTKTTPCIYWLPLTEAQAAEKAKQREAERERRLKEREKRRESDPTPPPRRNLDRERRTPPPRGRMDDWPRRRSPERRMLPDMRDRRR